ncbi:MAG: hypothetical protein GY805_28000 [Chloroflexi bacterium]|nr:hypothetical protein [Chloroflexota bacterium]
MPKLKSYYRPNSIDEALQLLARSGVNTEVIAGGTSSVPFLNETVDTVVDLQDVGLAEVDLSGSGLTLGAMVRLQTIVDDQRLPALLRDTAQREGPNTLRHAATIGGVVAGADSESELLAALLVFEANVHVQNGNGVKQLPLADFLLDGTAVLSGGLITAISLITTGKTAHDRVARTPIDSPIVAAVARLGDDGELRLALCGVADTLVLVNSDDVETAVTPPTDFRGSAEYRRQTAVTLSRRVIDKVT